MSGMEPMAIAALGAGGGALMDKKNPLRGAALGGLGGYFLGPAIAGAGGGVAPVVSGETAAAGGAAGFGGQQAAMLAAQDAGMGGGMMGGLAKGTLAANGGMAMSPAQYAMLQGQDAAFAGGAAGMPKGMDMARMGMQMAGSSRPQPQGGGMAAPMPMPQQQQPAGSFMASSPYSNPQDPYTAMMMRRYGQG